MIRPMKKYTFLVFHQDYENFVKRLGNLGVLHVIERKKQDEEKFPEELIKRITGIDNALDLIAKNRDEQGEKTKGNALNKDPEEIIADLEEKKSSMDDIQKEMEEIGNEIERVRPWGNYQRKDLKVLEEAGYESHLYRCPDNQFRDEWMKKYDLFIINDHEGYIYFLAFTSSGEDPDIDAETVKHAERSLEQLTEDLASAEQRLQELRKSIAIHAESKRSILQAYKSRLEDEVSLLSVYRETMRVTDEKLRILEGWVPSDSEEGVLKMTENEQIVCLSTKPAMDEQPPVVLKNRNFSRLFEPISNLFDLPSYTEMDLTPYFAPFFMLFFGFCLGDAGYGVFFILFAGLLKLKAKKEFRPILNLTQYLGIATIFFGLLSGTFFGINLIDSGYTLTQGSFETMQEADVPEGVVSQLRPLEGEYFKSRENFLNAVEGHIGAANVQVHRTEILQGALPGIPLIGKFRHWMQDSLTMFYLSILIGGLQILFGIFVRVMNISRQRGFRYALSPVGWLILITAVILHYTGILEGKTLTPVFYGLLGLAGVLIFFLNNPDANIFARIGGGVWDSYNMVTGLFGDLLSYIRLFALGISSAILGFVFNDISLQLLDVPYIGWLLFLVLLVVGHSINLFMATLGGFIHPMRLTFVEFYKNAGFKGGGKKYKPFIINN